MSLPKWIAPKDGYKLAWPERDYVNNLHEALSIAWEALEYGFNGRTIKAPGMSVQSRPLSNSEIRLSLEKAMRRIEELGK